MGVTIHFEGKLKSESSYDQILVMAKEYANSLNSEIIILDSPNKILKRVRNNKIWDYEGSVKGIQLQPNANSDPLVMQFDKNLYLQDFCKTQFAGIDTHISIIQFLRNIDFLFESLTIIDEGKYFETKSIEILNSKFDNFYIEFEKIKEEEPEYSGPYRVDGRIIDLLKK